MAAKRAAPRAAPEAEELPRPTADEVQAAIDKWIAADAEAKAAYERSMNARAELHAMLVRMGLNLRPSAW